MRLVKAPGATPRRVSHKPQPASMVGRTYLERGRPVRILARWAGRGPRNVLIAREDGSLVVRPFRGLRRIAPPDGT